MTQRYDIVGIGAALVDTEIRVADEDLKHLDIPKGLMTLCDETTQQRYIHHLREHLDAADRACGGSVANSIIATAHMHCKSFMTCKVADDEDGQLFLTEMASAGVDYNRADQSNPGTTGKCLVMVTSDAERTMNTALGISESLSPANVEPEIIKAAKYLYIEGYLATSTTGTAAAIAMREAAEQAQVKITLSLSDPGIVAHFKPQLRSMLGEQAHLIFCNGDEAISWTEANSLEQALELLKNDCEQYAVTLGAEGAVCWDGKTLGKVSTRAVKAIDTNGAGDMFAGCTLAALTQGLALSEAIEFGCYGASEVITVFGPRLEPTGYAELAKQLGSC